MRGSKTGCCCKAGGYKTPRTARHSRQTDCQPAPRVVVPADKRKQQQQSGFRRPATPFRWPYQSCLMLFGMPRGWGQSRQSLRRFWHFGIARVGARALCCGRNSASGTESSNPSAKGAKSVRCDITQSVTASTGLTRTVHAWHFLVEMPHQAARNHAPSCPLGLIGAVGEFGGNPCEELKGQPGAGDQEGARYLWKISWKTSKWFCSVKWTMFSMTMLM